MTRQPSVSRAVHKRARRYSPRHWSQKKRICASFKYERNLNVDAAVCNIAGEDDTSNRFCPTLAERDDW